MNLSDSVLRLKAGISTALAFGTALFGWVGWTVMIWLAAMLLDYLTGSLAAICLGEWKSSVARQGLWHKLGSIAAVLVAALCDIALGVVADKLTGIPFSYPDCLITPAVTVWYIFTELGSVIENADRLGAPMPDFLRRHIAELRKRAEEQEEVKK